MTHFPAKTAAPASDEAAALAPASAIAPLRQRVRIRFTKQGDLRWVGHRDLMRIWERLLRRAALPLGMSEGFHPKPRMNFPSALAVGIAGDDEMLELELSEAWSAEQVSAAIAAQAPPGLAIRCVEAMAPGSKKAQATHVTFAVGVAEPLRAATAERIAAFLAQTSVAIARQGRATPLDLRPLVERLALTDGLLEMRLRVDREGSARPREVLAAVGLDGLEQTGCGLTRTQVDIA